MPEIELAVERAGVAMELGRLDEARRMVRRTGWNYAQAGAALAALGTVLIGVVLAVLRPWSVQPVAANIFVVLGCGVAIAFELESRLALLLPPRIRLRGGVGVLRLVLFSVLLLGTCWSVVQLAAGSW